MHDRSSESAACLNFESVATSHHLLVASRALLANRLRRRHGVIGTVRVMAFFAPTFERLVRELHTRHARLEIRVTRETQVRADGVEQLRRSATHVAGGNFRTRPFMTGVCSTLRPRVMLSWQRLHRSATDASRMSCFVEPPCGS
jgi:hypothetical protein